MKLPTEKWAIDKCGACKVKLEEKNFSRCGVVLKTQQIFFDYECRACAHRGRWTIDIQSNMDAPEALMFLATTLAEGDSKGNIAADLNKIVGVQDLLKLGGKDAPRERRSDESSDLP